MTGKLFVIEGPDGCGKTTVWDCLKELLPQSRFLFVRDPGTTKISNDIRSILLNTENTNMCSTTELLLYTAARDQMVGEVILPALNSGIHVVSDRYIQSTIAYQHYGNVTLGGGVPHSLIINLSKELGHPVVDVLFNLSKGIDVKGIRERLAKSGKAIDRMESRSCEYFNSVLSAYRLMSSDGTPERHFKWYFKEQLEIDVSSGRDDIVMSICSAILSRS